MEQVLWVLVGFALGAGAVALLIARRSTRSPAGHASRSNRSHAVNPEGPPAGEILDRMAEGVIVLTTELTPVLANATARRLLGMDPDSLPPRAPGDELASVARRALVERTGVHEVIKFSESPDRSVSVRAAPVERPHGVAIVLRDVTEELSTQQIRRQFVSHASHELKSPVAGIQALAEAVSGALNDDVETARDLAGRLVVESERLGTLVRDLLDLSRLEDPANATVAEVDLGAVARAELQPQVRDAGTRSLQVDDRIEDGVVVRGDRQQLGLMIRNLLDNAIRYTPTGGRVGISIHQDRTSAIVEVSDTGIGIPLHAQARVFERFYRVDADRSRSKGGTGLGLAIVKHVVETHGGRVELASEFGEGSTFTARLPAIGSPDAISRTGE